MKEREEYAALV